MNKIIGFIFIVSFVITNHAQVNFEGTIKCSLTLKDLKSNETAPKELTLKQKEDLKKGIGELESKLKDPDLVAMLDANPSMKAMLEQQLVSMKAMQGDEGTAGLMPKSHTIKLKDGNTYTQVEGGAFAVGNILHIKLTDKTYYIKNASKTYSIPPKSKSTIPEESSITVTATSETAKIINYTCIKYVVTFTEAGKINQCLFGLQKI